LSKEGNNFNYFRVKIASVSSKTKGKAKQNGVYFFAAEGAGQGMLNCLRSLVEDY
jgi:hypothetical protein